MQQIPLQPIPSQQIEVVLGGQNCIISIYSLNSGIYADLIVNGIAISNGILALNAVPLNPFNYAPFIGQLIFIDTQGVADPLYAGLGTRWQLVYLSTADLAALGAAYGQ